MNRRITLLAGLAVAVAFSMAGCKKESGTNSSGGKKLVVGFSQVGAESGWRTAESNSVVNEAQKRGIDLKFADAQQKQDNQIKAMGTFVTQGVDAIILAPIVKTGWESVLKEARAAKIPVVLVDRGIIEDPSLYATLIAADFVEEGRMAGEWLAQKTNGKCSIVELEGTPGSDPANERKKGFHEAIAKHPGMKIIKSQTGNFERKGGMEVMEAFLRSEGKNIQAVYAHNDEMGLGAIEAIKAAGLKPGTDIIVVSIDGQKNAFEAMVRGELNCTIECNPLLGPAAFDAIKAALEGKELPKKTVVKSTLYDQSVAKEHVDARQY